MQVIGAGFPRTGTSSMKVALDRLGFGPCLHMFEVMGSPDLSRRWGAIADRPAAEVDWPDLMAGWRSSVDWPAAFFWRDLADAFPEARILLTVREPRGWYRSIRDTIFREGHERLDGEGAAPHLGALIPLLDRLHRAHFGGGFGQTPDERTAVAAFERHTDRVCAEVPADRLLVYRCGDGWEPLCAFLGVPVPDAPFPHLNDTAAMRRKQDLMRDGHLPTLHDP
jgi:hypothetical protein